MRRAILAVLMTLSATTALAASQEQPSCISVQVNGQPTPSYDCLNAQLWASAHSATPLDPQIGMKTVIGNGEPNRLGLATPTAASIRMGSNFGKSVTPQRP